MTKLFVVGFPRDMGEIELDQLFTLHALVKKITIIRDMQTGESKGYAFIDMMDESGAARVIDALDGMTFGKRTMSVRIANQQFRQEKQVRQQPHLPKNNIRSNTNGPSGRNHSRTLKRN